MPRITKPNLATDIIQYPGQLAEFSGSTSFIEGVFVKNLEIDTLKSNLIPQQGDALIFDGIKYSPTSLNQNSTLILTGLNVLVDPINALKFNVSLGSFKINGSTYTYSGGSIFIPSGDSINPRFDLITINTGSTLYSITGISQASPIVPQTPSNRLLLSIIQVNAGYYSGSTGATITSNVGNGVIGVAEDGTYADGLFTDFQPNTIIGVPVDRFNELFKAMLPDAAPSLTNINNTTNFGSNRKLSFGISKPISGYNNVNTTDGGIVIDYNDSFINGSNNNYRKGVFNSILNPTTKLRFNLNNDITSSYPNYSFSKGNSGLLKIELNDNIIHTLDLSLNSGVTSSISANTAIYLNNTNSLNYSLTGKKLDFDIFSYRTGYTIFNLSAGTKGFNYLKVSLDNVPTNYISWIDDKDNINPILNNSSYYVNSLNGGYYLSGIYYNTGATLSYSGNVSNCFKNTFINDLYLDNLTTLKSRTNTLSNGTGLTNSYSLTNGLFTPTTGTLSSNLNSHLTNLIISGIQTTVPNTTYLQNNNIVLSLSYNNSFDNTNSNISVLDTKILSGFSIYNPTNTTIYKKETFVNETYRLNNNAFSSNYTNINNGSLSFDSSLSIINGTDQGNNLLQYNGRLYYPSNNTLPASGDFTSTIYFANSASNNTGRNYSSVSGIIPVYYRYFKKSIASSNANLIFNISSVNITNMMISTPNTNPNSNEVAIEMIIYYSNGTITPIYNLFANNTVNPNGVGIVDNPPTLNGNNKFSFGSTTNLSQNDIIVIRVKYGTAVSGYISNIEIINSDF